MNIGIMQIFLIAYFFIGVFPSWHENVSSCEIVFGLLKGFSYEVFNLTEFLYYISFFLFPVFLINAFWEKEKENKNEIAMFRIGCKEKWYEQIYKVGLVSVIKFYLCYIAGLVITIVCCLCVCKGNNLEYLKELLDFYEASDTQVYSLAIGSILFKGLEIVLLYEINLLLYCYTKQTIFSFLGTMSIYVLGSLEGFNFFRVGKASVYQLLEDIQVKGNIVDLSIIIQIGILVILLIINHIGGKRYGECN